MLSKLRRWADNRFGFSPPGYDTFFDPLPDWHKITADKVYHSDFRFVWRGVSIDVEGGNSDGFTFYDWLTNATLGWLRQFDSGLPAAFTHDYLCNNPDKVFLIDAEYRAFTAEERALIFRDALRATGKVNRLREAIMWRTVLLATKHLGFCK